MFPPPEIISCSLCSHSGSHWLSMHSKAPECLAFKFDQGTATAANVKAYSCFKICIKGHCLLKMHLHLSCKLRAGSHCTLEGWFHHALAYKHISEDQAPVTVHEIANLSDWPGRGKLQSPIEMTFSSITKFPSFSPFFPP